MIRRIALKPPEYGDYVRLHPRRFDESVAYWADPFLQNLSADEYACGRLESVRQGEIFERIILLDGEPIGTVTAREFDRHRGCCTLGVVIVASECWGHGYGYEAIRMFLKMLAVEGVKCVALETYANNWRAQKCFAKLGFHKRRAYYSPVSGRFLIYMVKRLDESGIIGTVVKRGDPGWRPPPK